MFDKIIPPSNLTDDGKMKNRTIFTRDNLEVMRGIADECIDLIYLDPPFNSNHNYAAPIGSQAAGAEFKDTWSLNEIDLAWYGEIAEVHPGLYDLLTTTRNIHSKSMMAYLIYMAIRVMEIKRILKERGGVYLHCDSTAGHYLKLLMDTAFGYQNFRNTIIWRRDDTVRGAKKNSKQWPRVTDHILFYSKSKKWKFHLPTKPLTEEQIKRYRYTDVDGRKYRTSHLGDYSRESIEKLKEQGLIHISRNGNESKKYFLDEAKGTPYSDVWTDIQGFGVRSNAKEVTGYPTQKPLKLLERIIQTSSDPNDLILDPFCGCATTCVAAEKLNRKWVGIDISPKASELVNSRIHRELGFTVLKLNHRTDIPTDRDGKRSKNIRHILYGLQEGMCNGCGHWYRIKDLEVDHIVPKSKGGADTDENLQLLCGHCNRVKGDKSQEYLISQMRK